MKNKFNIPIIDVSISNLRNKERIALNNFIQIYIYNFEHKNIIRYSRVVRIPRNMIEKSGIDLLIIYKKIKL